MKQSERNDQDLSNEVTPVHPVSFADVALLVADPQKTAGLDLDLLTDAEARALWSRIGRNLKERKARRELSKAGLLVQNWDATFFQEYLDKVPEE